METYRLQSKLVGWSKEYVIQTVNDADQSAVSSVLIVDGVAVEAVLAAHPYDIGSDEILRLVHTSHDRTKQEVEGLLNACRGARESSDPAHLISVGLACLYRHLDMEARELFSKAVSLDSDGHQVWFYIGKAELALNQPQAAVYAAEQAVKLRPEFADYRNILGMALTGVHRYRHAKSEFERAIEINLYYAEAYFNIGLALLQNAINKNDPSLFEGVLSQSEEQFNRAAVIESDYRTPLFDRGIGLLRASDLQGAYDCLNQVNEKVLERHLHTKATYHVESTLHSDWSDEEALSRRVEFLQQEILRNPAHVDLVVQLGHCHLQQALSSFTQGLGQYRSALSVNSSLNVVQDLLDKGEAAQVTLDAVLELVPKKGWSG